MPSRILGIFAHPDDEAFGFAGTAMRHLDGGWEAGLVTLTRGDAGRWFGKRLGSWRKEDLARERAREWAAAVATVGLTRGWLLRYPDGGVAGLDPTAVTKRLAAIVRLFRPEVVVTFGPEGAGSEHDDHSATSRHASRAVSWAADPSLRGGRPHRVARLYYATAPQSTSGMRGRRRAGFLTPTHVVDVRDYVRRKAATFENHRTQFKDRPFFYEFLRSRGGREYFHLAMDVSARPREADLL